MVISLSRNQNISRTPAIILPFSLIGYRWVKWPPLCGKPLGKIVRSESCTNQECLPQEGTKVNDWISTRETGK